MKLKDLVNLSEKKGSYVGEYYPLTGEDKYNIGFDTALDQIGNIKIELDVEKILKIVIDYFQKEYKEKGEYFDIAWEGNEVIDGSFNLKELAQAIADNFKDSIKEIK